MQRRYPGLQIELSQQISYPIGLMGSQDQLLAHYHQGRWRLNGWISKAGLVAIEQWLRISPDAIAQCDRYIGQPDSDHAAL